MLGAALLAAVLVASQSSTEAYGIGLMYYGGFASLVLLGCGFVALIVCACGVLDD